MIFFKRKETFFIFMFAFLTPETHHFYSENKLFTLWGRNQVLGVSFDVGKHEQPDAK